MAGPHNNTNVPNLPALAIAFSMQGDDSGIEAGSELALPHGLADQFTGAGNDHLNQPTVQNVRAQFVNLVIHLRQSCTRHTLQVTTAPLS